MDIRQFGLDEDDLEALGYRVTRKADPGSDDPGRPASTRRARGDGAARRWFWTLVVLVGAGWFSLPQQRMPDPVSANQPDTVFSSARAMSQLVEIARAPRPVGSPEHARVAAYLSDRLRALGLDVAIQTGTRTVVDSGTATSAVVRNILARTPGTGSTGAIVLAAHYDGTPVSHGAGDNGVGVAAILETLRALDARPDLRNDVIVAFTDAAELGSLGAHALLDEHAWRPEMALALSVDLHGVSGPALLVEELDRNGAIIRTAGPILPGSTANSTLRAVAPLEDERGSDLAVFTGAGIPGMGFTSYGDRAAYHGAADRPINVSERTLQHHGAQLLAVTRAFGDADLGAGLATETGARTYFSLPALGLVDQPGSWSVPLTVALVLGYVVLVLLFRVTGGDPKRALAGVALGVAVTVLSAAAGWGLLELLAGIHREMGRIETAVYREGAHGLALVAIVAAIVCGGYALARSRFGRQPLVVGALLLPVAAAVWMAFSAPYALVSIQIPLGLSLVAAMAAVAGPPRLLDSGWGWLGLVALSVGILLVAVPGLHTAWSVLTLTEAPLLGAAAAVGTLLLLPTVEWLVRPRSWGTPLVGVVVAAAAVLLASPLVLGDEDHPIPTSLILLADDTVTVSPVTGTTAGASRVAGSRGTGPGTDVAGAGSDPGRPLRWLQGRWLTVPGVGEEWARSWVVGGDGFGTAPGALLLPPAEWTVAGTGAEVQLGLPSIEVVGDRTEGGRRALTLRVRPGLDAEMIGVRIPDGADGAIVAVSGRSLDAAGPPVRTLIHWGRPEDEMITVALTGAEDGIAFDLLEHHLRPAEILGEGFFQRADSVIADASTGSDRIIQRVRVNVPAS